MKIRLLAFLLLLEITGCKKTDTASNTALTGNADVNALINLKVPNGFNYKLDEDVQIDITILAPDNTSINFIPVYILDKPADEGGKILFTSLTDANGKISAAIKLPSYLNEVVVDPNYVGVIRNAIIPINNNSLSCTLGGSSGYSGDILPDAFVGNNLATLRTSQTLSTPYSFMGTYDNHGKPNYLVSPNDVISRQLLSFINASLPEGKAVGTYHPAYLSSTAETNVNITTSADVYFTFVSEGAAYKNTIAYFTYPTGNPPQSASAIDSLHIILPNASLKGSGGSLQAGNKIRLGTFNAGTSIGFALIANAWNGSGVGNGYYTLYSVDKLNPESQASLQRHAVLLYNNNENLFLVGMEDVRRDEGSDNDFNDVTFYITSTPNTAISNTNVNPIDQPVDSDGDGVSDIYDKFPHDPTRAYINEYPAPNTYGTLAFEDSWPYIGDYDMNDLVVGYHYTLINDALNRTVELDANYVLKAAGSYFHNGFGVEFPFPASIVQSVSGTAVQNNQVVKFAANGCEAGQIKAVIIPFDDAFSVMNTTGGFNTYTAAPFFTPDTIRMSMKFNAPITAALMGSSPFNPFIIINKTRGREAHLPGNTPTQLINTKLFQTGQDNTNAANNTYYKTTSNLPWALSFTNNFYYPQEGKAINICYTEFASWAQSGGTTFTNWYTDSSYIVPGNIY